MEKELGPEAKLKIEGKDGKLVISLEYGGVDMSAGAYVQATPKQICEALAKFIPGDSTAEHIALGVVEGALDLAVKAI